tara:strand:+ start:770 stop:1786 length:1017 start_codon:yes stop_codon:yes gene_type:complete
MNWGIIGMGYMAKKFANSFSNLNHTKLIAISSKSLFKLKKYGDKFRISKHRRFNDYEKILLCDEIDNIYISTINNSHFEIINKAIKYKKNILCEKPMVTNYEEAKEIVNKLRKNNVFFMESIPYILHPLTNFLLKVIKEKTIGDLVEIKSTFGNNKSTKNNQRLFDKNLGGGAILDLGCYPITFSNLIANLENSENELPKITKAHGNISKNKVDTEASIKLSYENGLESNISVSIINNMENKTILVGKKGEILINNLWSPELKSFLEVDLKSRYYKLFVQSKYSLIENQINYVNQLINNNKFEASSKKMNWSNSLDNAYILEQWKQNLIKRNENQQKL